MRRARETAAHARCVVGVTFHMTRADGNAPHPAMVVVFELRAERNLDAVPQGDFVLQERVEHVVVGLTEYRV